MPRLVLLSGRGEEEAERAERAARDCGAELTLGREPRDFGDYARDAAATGIWNPRATRAA
jgi:hypothetical protein